MSAEFRKGVYLNRPPSFHNDIVTLFPDFDLDLRVLVSHLENARLFAVDKPLQGEHVGPVHTLEIISFVQYFSHRTPLPSRYAGQLTGTLINLVRCVF
jgi:hypothetical protein